jgi:hypothetical protein
MTTILLIVIAVLLLSGFGFGFGGAAAAAGSDPAGESAPCALTVAARSSRGISAWPVSPAAGGRRHARRSPRRVVAP